MGEYSARALHGNRSWVNLAGLAHQGFFFNGEVSERSKEHAWKVCVRQKRTEGSNPSLSAIQSYQQFSDTESPRNSPRCPGTYIIKTHIQSRISEQ